MIESTAATPGGPGDDMKEAARSTLTALDWIGAILALLALGYIAAFPLVVAPGVRRVLEDFGGTPPAFTRVALASWFPLSLAVAPATALIASIWLRMSLARRRVLIALSFGASAAGAALLHYALFLPALSVQIK